MHCRVIKGLKWVKELDNRPNCIPKSQVRGIKRVGLTYEGCAGKAIERVFGGVSSVKRGKWFSFEDFNGLGYCQPDIIVDFRDYTLVCECKLTETKKGRDQINVLYRPILEFLLEKPVKGVVIARHLTRETDKELICGGMGEVLERLKEKNFVIPTLHWLGRGRI